IAEVGSWFRRHKHFPELKDLFREIVHQGMRRGGKRARVPEDLLNMKSNMPANIEKWAYDRFTESMAKGKAESLVSLLISRFGALPVSFRKRIERATLASIERWFKRALNAEDLPSVFGRSR